MDNQESDLKRTYGKILKGISTIERYIEGFGLDLSEEDYHTLVYRLTVLQKKAEQLPRE